MQRISIRIGLLASLGAAVAVTLFVFPRQLAGQAAPMLSAPGRFEGAGPPMAVGVAVGGVISEVLVHEGSRVRTGDVMVKFDCRPAEADVQARSAQLNAAQAVFDRARNGSRPDEIAVGEAVVGYSLARAEEAQKTLERTEAMHEGVTVTVAHVLEVKRDARIAAAQLAEARAKPSLLKVQGSREEEVREAQGRRDVAAAELESARARLEQCSVRAPADGIVLEVSANPGQFVSLAVPEPLLHMAQDNRSGCVPRSSREISGGSATGRTQPWSRTRFRLHQSAPG